MRYVAFVLDESGSMDAVRHETISGFNEYIKTLRQNKSGKTRFTLTKFNSSRVEIVHDTVKLGQVVDLATHYYPGGLTPLYDAIGRTIKTTEKAVGDNDRVLVVIQTDGYENDSKEYTQSNIFDLIASKREAGWEFVFLGADQDAYAASAGLGIASSSTVSYRSDQTLETFVKSATASVQYLGGQDWDFDTNEN